MSGGSWRKCSSSPISTKTALSHAEGRFCGDAPLLCSGALLCLGALPLLYPAAPPSVFAFGKYTAPAVALVREVSAMLRAVFVEMRMPCMRISFSTPVSCADSPFQGHAACAFGSGRWLRCFNFLAEVSLTLLHGGIAAFGLRPQNGVSHFLGRFRTRT